MAIKIALAGNPNCGKTTMFNALTGANQYVGNWPGVTVEKKEGKLKSSKSGEEIIITDLPGVYSLSPYTLEEVVSRDYLVHEKPQAIINLVDATNIERNLYLTTQILEIGIPVVIALNMADLLAKSGDKIDVKKLSEIFGCEVVETSALKGTGLKEVVERQRRRMSGRTRPASSPEALRMRSQRSRKLSVTLWMQTRRDGLQSSFLRRTARSSSSYIFRHPLWQRSTQKLHVLRKSRTTIQRVSSQTSAIHTSEA